MPAELGGCKGVKVKELFMQIDTLFPGSISSSDCSSFPFLELLFVKITKSIVDTAFQDHNDDCVHQQVLLVLNDLTLGPPLRVLSALFKLGLCLSALPEVYCVYINL